jgi:hypothetical protein
MGPQMPHLTVKSLITEDLGYCCLFAFFSLHKDTKMIADRLGFCTRAIRYHKMAFRQGDLNCEMKPKCLRCRIR